MTPPKPDKHQPTPTRDNPQQDPPGTPCTPHGKMDLMEDRRCTAKSKRSGERCKRSAILGGNVCTSHGGRTPVVKAAAERRLAMRKAVGGLRALGYDPDAGNLDPAEQLLRLVSDKAREVAWLRHMVDQVAAGGDQDDHLRNPLVWGVTSHQTGVGPMGPVDVESKGADLNVWVKWLHAAEDALARYATAALKAGVQQRQLEIQEALALQFVGAIHTIIGALQLTAAQQQTAATIIPTVLRSLDNQEQS